MSDFTIDIDEHKMIIRAIPVPCIIISHDYGDHEGEATIDNRAELIEMRDAINRALGD